jgi:hypothetical protein
MNVMEVVLEDQIFYVDSMEEVSSDENPIKKLLKKEQRLIERLHEEQDAEAMAQERFQQAQKRLQRRRKRLERIQGKLVHVREQLAELQMIGHQPVYSENEIVIVPTQELATHSDFEEVTLVQPEQNNVVAQEPEDLSPAYTEYTAPDTSASDQENTSMHIDVSDVPAVNGNKELAIEQEFSSIQPQTTSPSTFTYEPIEAIVESEPGTTSEVRSNEELFAPEQETSSSEPLSSIPFESTLESEAPSSHAETDFSNTSESEQEAAQELEASSHSPAESFILSPQEQEPVATLDSTATEAEVEVIDSNDLSSETNTERKPTKPLQLEQPGLPAAESHTSDIQLAKEAWIAAESAMQNIRNAANSIATSISFLSQTDGLSSEFMEELVRKQADANRELLKAQDTARAAYERFVQAQRDAQPATSQSINTSEGSSQHKQEDASLPPAAENGLDQTAKLHAIRLYTEW